MQTVTTCSFHLWVIYTYCQYEKKIQEARYRLGGPKLREVIIDVGSVVPFRDGGKAAPNGPEKSDFWRQKEMTLWISLLSLTSTEDTSRYMLLKRNNLVPKAENVMVPAELPMILLMRKCHLTHRFLIHKNLSSPRESRGGVIAVNAIWRASMLEIEQRDVSKNQYVASTTLALRFKCKALSFHSPSSENANTSIEVFEHSIIIFIDQKYTFVSTT